MRVIQVSKQVLTEMRWTVSFEIIKQFRKTANSLTDCKQTHLTSSFNTITTVPDKTSPPE